MWKSGLVLVGAAVWDFLIGDPWSWPHPVQFMGWVIAQYSKLVFQFCPSALGQKVLGILLMLLLMLGSGGLAWLVLWKLDQWSPLLKIGVEIVLLASCFAGRSLRRAAEDVLSPLAQQELAEARSRLSHYVGRETQHLDQPDILRAVLETVSENSVDGVMAPLFYAWMGLVIPIIGPVPLAIAYKAVSTLDSMVGYRETPYTHLGWCSAKTDDILTWLPCRSMVLTIALLSPQPWKIWQICCRDAPRDPSPNSGWSECAFAASLGVQLGGANVYRGQIKHKPLMGDSLGPITPSVIHQGLRLVRHCFILWIILALSTATVIDYG